MLPIILHEAAEEEMADAILWYERKEQHLGTDLREKIEAAISKIQQNPDAHQVVEGSGIKRLLTERFPYSIIYAVEEDHTFIVSVFHTSRNPIIWRGRVG
jgi:plasmid stabilization system protein ParE